MYIFHEEEESNNDNESEINHGNHHGNHNHGNLRMGSHESFNDGNNGEDDEKYSPEIMIPAID